MRFTFASIITFSLGAVVVLVILDKGGALRTPRPAMHAPAPVAATAPATAPAPAQAPAPAATAAAPTAPAAAPGVRVASVGEAPEETPDILPEGEHRDMVFYRCTACHSAQVVSRQGMSRSLWEESLAVMIEKHGMAEPTPEDREQILDYLTAAFPPAAPSGRPGFVNPFAN
ncbi:MAG: hypothetical protein IT557_12115 [Alphaproteobacteria bacterium]|nr:hypothetical protein [Alphaproteobacteria bacterium]